MANNGNFVRRGHSSIDITGNLGDDPVAKETGSGTLMTRLRVAVNRNWTDAQGNKKEDTDWYTVLGFGKRAQNMKEYCYKGQSVRVIGQPRMNSWVDKHDQKRSDLEIHVSAYGGEIIFLTMRPNTPDSAASDGSEDHKPVVPDGNNEPF